MNNSSAISNMAAALAAKPAPPAGRPAPRAVLLGRHISVRHALQAYGLPEALALELAEGARCAGQLHVAVELAPLQQATGCRFTMLVRRMPGNLGEEWIIPPEVDRRTELSMPLAASSGGAM